MEQVAIPLVEASNVFGINRLTIDPQFAQNLAKHLGPLHPLVLVGTDELSQPYFGTATLPGHGTLDIYSPARDTPLERIPDDYFIARYTSLQSTSRLAFFYQPGSHGSRAIAKMRDELGMGAETGAQTVWGPSTGISEVLRLVGLPSDRSLSSSDSQDSNVDDFEEGVGSSSSGSLSHTLHHLRARLDDLRDDDGGISGAGKKSDEDSDESDGPSDGRRGNAAVNVSHSQSSSASGNGSMGVNTSQGLAVPRGPSIYAQPFAGFSGAFSFAGSLGSVVSSLRRSTGAMNMPTLERFLFGATRRDPAPRRSDEGRSGHVSGSGMVRSRGPGTGRPAGPISPVRQHRFGNVFRQLIPNRVRGFFRGNKNDRRKLIRRRSPRP